MHLEAYGFAAQQSHRCPRGGRVLEYGSYNVNGSVRDLYAHAGWYVGIDLRPGPDVDVVSTAANYTPPEPVDVVICCESLEHDPEPDATIAAAWDALKPGGWLILTAASHTRTPHGCDGGAVGTEHYQAVHPDDLLALLRPWDAVEITHHAARGDVYAIAQKPE